MLTLRVVIPYKFSAFVKDFISDPNLTQAAKLYDDRRSVSSEIEMTSVMIRDVLSKNGSNGLQSKDNFDNVKPLNGKPSVVAEGFNGRKTSDLVAPKSVDGELDTPILTDAPNLYKQTGAFVNNIPYNFRAIPDEFLTDDFIDDPIMMRFIRWMFKRISSKPSSVPIKNNRKILELDSFEFMYGRKKCAEQAGITLKQAESRIGQLLGMNYVTKVGIKSGSTFSVYRLVTTSFLQNSGQQVGQQVGHNLDHRSKRIDKKDHPPTPSFEKKASDGMKDESFKNNKKKAAPSNEGKILVHNGVYLTQAELDDCIQFHGSIEKVKWQIEKILTSPNRTQEITRWAYSIKKWKFPNETIDRSQHNEQIAKRIEQKYEGGQGWMVTTYRDPKKDCTGLLFQNPTGYGEPIYIIYTDPDFEKKVEQTIKAKHMKAKGEK